MLLCEKISQKGKIVESNKSNLPNGVLLRVTYPICRLGVKNANGRVYERAVWDNVLNNPDMTEKMSNRCLYGSPEHPEATQLNLKDTSHIIIETKINENDNTVYQTMDVLDTEYGRIIETLLRAECQVGVSTRAEGELEEVKEATGSYMRVVPDTYKYVTTDFTADPSTKNPYPVAIEKRVVQEIREGLSNNKITKQFATHLLESMQTDEAKNMLKNIKDNSMKIGDMVKIKEGALKGTVGKISKISEANVNISTGEVDITIAKGKIEIIDKGGDMPMETPLGNAPMSDTTPIEPTKIEGPEGDIEKEAGVEEEMPEPVDTPDIDELKKEVEGEDTEDEDVEKEEEEDETNESKVNESFEFKDPQEFSNFISNVSAYMDKIAKLDKQRKLDKNKEHYAEGTIFGSNANGEADKYAKENDCFAKKTAGGWVIYHNSTMAEYDAMMKKKDPNYKSNADLRDADESKVDEKFPGHSYKPDTIKTNAKKERAEASEIADDIKDTEEKDIQKFIDKKKEANESKLDEKMSIEVIEEEGNSNGLKKIADKLQSKFESTKKANPKGYMDAFESRFGLNCVEVAKELGIKVETRKDGTTVFNYTNFKVKEAKGKLTKASFSIVNDKLVLDKPELKNESVDTIRQLQIKCSGITAEKEKAVEILEALEKKLSKSIADKTIEIKALSKKLSEKKVSDPKEIEALRDVIERKSKSNKELSEQIKQITSDKDKEIKTFKEHISSLKSDIRKINESSNKTLLKKYIEARVKMSGLKLHSGAKALLESQTSFEEVDATFDNMVNILRENALHSTRIDEIKLESKTTPEDKALADSFKNAFAGILGK